ncbi:hypothetical protein [Bacteroides helcogenes]|uniref:Lipoprotein n=1 Tax=Bacteroides helcogenes (strain ATCC 35417 / DSM 20613 / JCM 6297 / CCUG 15421 / P 36-108) TaxID=693979 RepID=E6SRA2_BACT6|nr:hypothetical protein [Bacteroides helcogenes]ADV43046.1 hypothetical protein Bache_1036 [Bacteroides helcogenes P 36-108]MDY5236911.1 hypothetical protein [Bacteroides helcogenes]
MRKKHIWLLLSLVTFISGCDYVGGYCYYIENRLPDATVTVKTHRKGYQYPTEIKDSIFIILPNEKKLINVTPTGICGKHEHPSDIMAEGYHELGELEVFVDGRKVENDFWDRKYWEYTTEELEGTYLLIIDEQIITRTP